MWRFFAGAAAAFLLLTGAFLIWQSRAEHGPSGQGLQQTAPSGPSWFGGSGDQPLRAPEASDKSHEEKRFSRYDKNKDGKVQADEYLATRRKNFDKLDTNHDGRLAFEEYASKAIDKFNGAGGHKGCLTAAELATTAPVRKVASKRCSCRASAPAPEISAAPADDSSDNN